MTANHLTALELEAGLDGIRQSPRDAGVLRLIVRRPSVNEREIVEHGELTTASGLAGDTWKNRGKNPHPDVQLTLMNARAIQLIAGDETKWPLAGDQLFVDFDLSISNLPAGSRLAIGSAIIEVTAEPHTGCSKFVARFGQDARQFVNSKEGLALRLRGANAKVVRDGQIRQGDSVRKADG